MVFHNNDCVDGGITLHLFTMFSECPLESIQIEGGRDSFLENDLSFVLTSNSFLTVS